MQETPECEVIGSSAKVHVGYEEILYLKPDALLLDISLDGGTAFELIHLMKQNNIHVPPVVIMTGDPNYTVAGEALDIIGPSLVKLIEKPFWKTWPVDFPIIKSAILSKMVQLQHDDPDLLLRTMYAQEELFIRSSHMTYRIVLPEVLYLDAEKGFTTFVIRGDKTIKVRKTLNEIMGMMPA